MPKKVQCFSKLDIVLTDIENNLTYSRIKENYGSFNSKL